MDYKPFLYNLERMPDDDHLKDELIYLRANRNLKIKFENETIEEFWCSTLNLYPKIGKKSLFLLTPFSTTYLCESGFSSLLSIKTKHRNCLNPQSDLRIAISEKNPRFEKLMKQKQEQKSH